jgi:hypothetical protein
VGNIADFNLYKKLRLLANLDSERPRFT